MSTTTTGTRCWTLTDPDDELAIWEANGHFDAREKAQAHLDGLAAEGYDMTSREVTQVADPCHTVTCACGYQYDTEELFLAHWPTREEAVIEITDAGWTERPDGTWICPACADD